MDAEIAGAALTRFGMFTDVRLRDLAAEAADAALADSGLRPEEIGLVVFGNAAAGVLTGQEMIRAQVSLGASRVAGRPMLSVENACASSSSAFHLGALSVASGEYDAVLVVGAEKMTNTDRTLSARALATAVDVEQAEHGLLPAGAPPAPAPAGPVFMEIYAATAVDYMARTGATARDFATVAAKNTRNGSLNPNAQVRTPLDPDEVLAARTITGPLTRPMCSSIGDGAAAVVLCAPRAVRARGLDTIRVLASVLGSGAADDPGDLVTRTAHRAFQQAAVGPQDIGVAEVHDAAAPAELLVAEELGFAAPGDGPKLLRDGTTQLDGSQPVNPSGGLLARGHPIGATGLAQLVELTNQLRERAGRHQVRDPRIALAENAGGDLGNGPAACTVTILAGT